MKSMSNSCEIKLGSHVAQLVGCWTHNPRVEGSIPGDADCFLGKMLTWTVPLSTQE